MRYHLSIEYLTNFIKQIKGRYDIHVYKIIADLKIFSYNFTVQNFTVYNILMGEIRAIVLFLFLIFNIQVK